MQQMQNKLSAADVMEGSTSLCEFKIVLSADALCLQLSFLDDTVFGTLNELASKILKEIPGRAQIRLQPFVDRRKVTEIIGKARKESDATVSISVHIYGPKSKSEDIGDHLSDGKMWLQRPDLPQALEIYDNPHHIKFEGLESSLSLSEVKQKANASQNTKAQDSIDSLKSDIYSALQKTAENVQRMTGDSRLKSKLLEYVSIL
jgi:SWI/SNF-related matrix-associated actin-dependent regulator of chromatin subfamily A3